jgi:hypothetical protein
MNIVWWHRFSAAHTRRSHPGGAQLNVQTAPMAYLFAENFTGHDCQRANNRVTAKYSWQSAARDSFSCRYIRYLAHRISITAARIAARLRAKKGYATLMQEYFRYAIRES